MFQRIARRYDAFNTVATFGRDAVWRRKAAKLAAPARVAHALDAATGTGKLALELAKRGDRVTAFDFSDRMVDLAHKRLISSGPLESVASVLVGDAMATPFHADTFDCATIAFGIRNVEDHAGCLEEFYRVLRTGGRLVILEISRPSLGIYRVVYEAVFKRVLPLVGWAVSGDRSAYKYLPNSVDAFLSSSDLANLMESAGFTQVNYKSMHLDTITLHLGVKPG